MNQTDQKQNNVQQVEKLQDAIGLIKDEYIMEAHEPEKKNWNRVIRFSLIGAAAAVVVIIAAVAIILPGNQKETGMNANVYEAASEVKTADDGLSVRFYRTASASAEENADIAGEEMMAEAAAPMEAADFAAEDGYAAEAAAPMEAADLAAEDGYAAEAAVPAEEAVPDEVAAPADETNFSEQSLVITTKEQFDDFFKNSDISPEPEEGDAESFYESLATRYDEAFFADHNLAISFAGLSSGAYQLTYLRTEESGTKAVQYYQVYRPDKDPAKQGTLVTADWMEWMVISAVSKDVAEVEAVEEAYPYN